MSDAGLTMGNEGWMFQTEKQHEQLYNGLKVQRVGMGEKNYKLFCNFNKPLGGPEVGLPS